MSRSLLGLQLLSAFAIFDYASYNFLSLTTWFLWHQQGRMGKGLLYMYGVKHPLNSAKESVLAETPYRRGQASKILYIGSEALQYLLFGHSPVSIVVCLGRAFQWLATRKILPPFFTPILIAFSVCQSSIFSSSFSFCLLTESFLEIIKLKCS